MTDLIDIGVNLAHQSFEADRDAVVARANEVGVRRMIITGVEVDASEQAADLAATRPGAFWSTAGVHPHHSSDLDTAGLSRLAKLLEREQVVAVGETGLDFFRNFSPPADQIAAFRAQLDLAVASGLPVFLHQRDAHDTFLELLAEYRGRIGAGVAHCFTGNERELNEYLELDLYIGITGWICDERRGQHLLALVGDIPADRLLLETDAPYLLPRNLAVKPKTRRNEPQFLVQVLETVAAATGKSPQQIAAETSANADRLFGL
jgi:TatD DNase family protein